MAKEMIVSVNGREKKIAIIEDDVVTEFYVERGDENQGIVGNIYKGKVMKVLPGMQSAFVDIGLERDSFLYVSDFLEDEEFEGIFTEERRETQPKPQRPQRAEKSRPVREVEVAAEENEDDKEAELQAAALSHIEELSEEPVIEPEPEAAAFDEAVVEASEETSARLRRRQRLSYEEAEDGEPVVASSPEEVAIAASVEAAEPEIVYEAVTDAVEETAEEEPARGRRRRRGGRRRRGEEAGETVEAAEPLPAVAEAAPQPVAEPERIEVFEPAPYVSLPQETFERVVDDEAAALNHQAEPLHAEEYVTTLLEVEPTPEAHVGSLRSSIGAGSEFERVSDDSGEPAAEESEPDETLQKAEHAPELTLHAAQSPSEALEKTEETPLADAEARLREARPREEFATRRGGRGRRYRQRAATTDATAEAEAATAAAEDHEEDEPVAAPVAVPRSNGRTHRPVISDLLREGQEILVQIAKEPIGQKGARITSHIALPGRYIVYMPTVEHIGVSRKIGTDEERQRLRRTLHQLRAEDNIPGGFIVRTAAAGRTTDELRDDVQYLFRTWTEIRRRGDKSKAPAIIHRDLDLVQRILRDQLSGDFSAIRVDNEEEYERVVDFVNRFAPKLVRRVKLYTKDTPILEEYGVQAEIDKAVKPRVWLKSGGYIVINQTEALVAIDVNTGKFVGRSNRLEDTIVKTNIEAAREIARQIRLRDLGGIIVLDFIDMEERRNRVKVMQALEQELRADKSPSKVLQFNDFGLVAITRKRVKQSLERTLCTPCSYCGGGGMVKSAQTVCYEILAEARRIARTNDDYSEVILRLHPEVSKTLRTTERDVLNEIEAYFGTPLTIKSDPTVHQEQFDIALV
ncbi:MAG TPA: Rne/Rng family ribonuclease [Blastocatellia bacterium]|nr:Rne/Rng family ribonuclease [Blastocatellia bacterium]